MDEVKPGMTLEFADYVLRDPKGRYNIVFGLGSTTSTVTFDVGWHGERNDERAIELMTMLAKSMEPQMYAGTREVVFLSCEYLEQPAEEA